MPLIGLGGGVLDAAGGGGWGPIVTTSLIGRGHDPKKVIGKIRETPIKDVFTQDGYLRPDGRMVHSVALTQIKAPGESTSEWDLTKVIAKLAGDDVFRPLADGGCPALASK